MRARLSRVIEGLGVAVASAVGLALLVAAYLSLTRPIAIATSEPPAVARFAPTTPSIRRMPHAHVTNVRVARERHVASRAKPRSRTPGARDVAAGSERGSPRLIIARGHGARNDRGATRAIGDERTWPAARIAVGRSRSVAFVARKRRPADAVSLASGPAVPEPPLAFEARPELARARPDVAPSATTAEQLVGLRLRGREIVTPTPGALGSPAH